MLPTMAHGASSQGSPLCATSHSNSRSVLPGRGKGMTEESSTATEKSPRYPKCVSQYGISERCARVTGDGAGCWTKRLIQTGLAFAFEFGSSRHLKSVYSGSPVAVEGNHCCGVVFPPPGPHGQIFVRGVEVKATL